MSDFYDNLPKTCATIDEFVRLARGCEGHGYLYWKYCEGKPLTRRCASPEDGTKCDALHCTTHGRLNRTIAELKCVEERDSREYLAKKEEEEKEAAAARAAAPRGWICPVCHRGVSPAQDYCPCLENED